MKKFRNCLIAFLLLLVLPLGVVLTACGATPSNEVKSVFFDTQIYDEETGYAVFEVDFNRETELTYKVNPSTWSGYKPVYQTLRSGENEQNRTRFELKDGKITITDRAFEPITVQISINDYKDICIIRLKEYPTDIFFRDDEGNPIKEYNAPLSAEGAYKIHVFGSFSLGGGKTEVRELKDDRYKFNVVSSDSTVIQVKNKERLAVNTLKTKPESASVTINLLDADGNVVGSTLKVNFGVTPLVGQGFVDLQGYDKYITDGNEETIVIYASTLETYGSVSDIVYVMNYDIDLYSSTGIYIYEEEYTVEVISNLQKYVKAVEDKKIEIKTSSNLNFKLTFGTNLNNDTGTPYAITFNVEFRLY